MVKIIENYTLHEQIGEGEYGKVYKGVDTRNNRQVAVKVIHVRKFKENPKLEECTLNEIEVLSKIDSPHIVKFIEILKTVNNFYFFYEYCNQGTLQQQIKAKGVLQQKLVLNYLQQILQAFRILAKKNIMHRDLKPSNILLHNGKIKLGDFGFCKSLQNHRDLAQTMLGSPIYMAPQVLKGEIYTIKADIWSLGVVIYQMLYGYCPYEESSIARLINILDCQQLRFNSDINPVSNTLEELIRRMLVKDHFKRISWDEIFTYNISNGTLMKKDALNQRKPMIERNYKAEQQTSCENKENAVPKDGKMFKKKQQQPRSINRESSKNVNREPFKLNSREPSLMDCRELSKPENPPRPCSFQGNDSIASVDSSTMLLHNKLTNYIRLIHEFILSNYCPQLTAQLAVKLYQVVLKQHYKLVSKRQYIRERAELSELIRMLQQSDTDDSLNNSGPLLSKYIKTLQMSHTNEFTLDCRDKKKSRLLTNCIQLLDMNDLHNLRSIVDYANMDRDKLLQQFNQKLIRNII